MQNVAEFFCCMKFDIIPNRNLWFSISGGLVFLSLLFISIFGLNAGIDFTGGTRLEISSSNGAVTQQQVQELFQGALGDEMGEVITATFDGGGYIIRSRLLTDDEVNSLSDAFAQNGASLTVEQVNTIGPTVGEVFKKRAFIAVSLAILTIILYVAWAFRHVPEGLSSWKFGLAAIAALAHDTIIVVGIFALLGVFYGVEVDTLFITALLTVLAFSINDTIVIFDRIRENLKGEKNKKNLAKLTEVAAWQSMRRSMNTSISTLLVIFAMMAYFMGFSSLFAFFIALSAGLIIGTYSSLFIAAPLIVIWHKKD